MHGYLRRKVTYNLGKGGGRKASPSAGTSGTESQGSTPGLFGLFTNHDFDQNIKETHVIIDEAGIWKVEKEYVETGIEEGWLAYQGRNHGGENEIVHRYVMR